MSLIFYAGAAARCIVPTPDIVNNSLHSNMTVRFDEQGSRLQTKALCLGFNERNRILVAIDNVGANCTHCLLLRQAIADATNTAIEDIVISSSHSHSTPFLESPTKAHPYFEFVKTKAVEAAIDAVKARRPARIGNATVNITDASFNTRVPQHNGGVKYTRDFREGLASGRPVDPRLSLVRIDDENGKPIAGWVRFAAHPACVIFNAPISAEYPGYLTDTLSQNVAGGVPILFGYGAAGDVNCIPMFGSETDSAKLGQRLAEQAAPVFKNIKTRSPKKFSSVSCDIELPLDPMPTLETLDYEIEAVRAFTAALDNDSSLEWVLGINCNKSWSVQAKKAHVAPLAEWATRVKQMIISGKTLPKNWPMPMTIWMIDELGIVFYGGEPLVELGLELSARSPLADTLVIAMSNDCDAYLGSDEDHKRGGYEVHTATRYLKLAEGRRPLPYAFGAGNCFLDQCLRLINSICHEQKM